MQQAYDRQAGRQIAECSQTAEKRQKIVEKLCRQTSYSQEGEKEDKASIEMAMR